jgi:hypothetical protein
MALILGQNTYCTEAEAAEYIDLVGGDELSDAEPLLKRATMAIDRLYGAQFIGRKQNTTQALQWPRTGYGVPIAYDQGYYTTDADGNPRDLNVIPLEVKQATIEMAMILDAEEYDPYTQPEARLESSSVQIAVIKVDSTFKSGTGYAADPQYKIRLVLRPILEPAGMIRLVR